MQEIECQIIAKNIFQIYLTLLDYLDKKCGGTAQIAATLGHNTHLQLFPLGY